MSYPYITLDSFTEAAADAILATRAISGNEVKAARLAFEKNGISPTELDLFNASRFADLRSERNLKQTASAS